MLRKASDTDYQAEWATPSFAPATHTHDYADITGKPTTFTPATHTHSATDITTGTLNADRLTPGSSLTVHKSGTSWPDRPTTRTDITVHWVGPDPSPSIVSSGSGGMYENDIRFLTD